MGAVSDFDLTAIYDAERSLADGALLVPGYSMDGWYGRIFRGAGFDMDKPVGKYSQRELRKLLHGQPEKINVEGVNLTFEGVLVKVQKSMLSKDVEAMQPHVRRFVERAVTFQTCPDCEGTRLTEQARSSRIQGRSIAELSALQVSDLAAWLRGVTDPGVAPLVAGLQHLLDSFTDIGLGYLSLDRPAGTLSGGEAQRTKMIRHLGSALTDVTYVFDEPTIGLHPHDIQRMNTLLLQLRDKGNTVLVVEHKPETIAIADHAVDLGPGAGTGGGTVCYEGPVEGLRGSDTVTGRHLEDRAALKEVVRTATGALEVRGADTHNLCDVDVDLPLGVLCVLTGVAGSGKSSLIQGSVAGRDGVVVIDQGAIKGSRRSNPATYTGLLEPIRKAFAKENGVKPALFSANSEGACPACNGAGVVFTDLGVMATVESTCEECEGRRFQAAVLEYRLGGRHIGEVLEMPVAEARWRSSRATRCFPTRRASWTDSSTSVSVMSAWGSRSPRLGRERQLKLAAQMGEKGDVFVLDEPTTGLHLADVQQLLAMLDRLVDAGRSVLVIEHHQAVMAHADWIVDLGPRALATTVVGSSTARTPADLVAERASLSGQHLASTVVGA
ncbi:MAG: excinuclease ABC subunit UvrA [Nocardioides sp.]